MSLQVYRRAQGLLTLDQGQTLQQAAAVCGVNYNTVAAWRDAYRCQGLGLLQDKPRSGRPVQIDGWQRAAITALACSAPPQGHARWSLRLLADKIVELGYVESISHDSVHQIFKKTIEAAPQEDLVSEQTRQPVLCLHGAVAASLFSALRSRASRGVL